MATVDPRTKVTFRSANWSALVNAALGTDKNKPDPAYTFGGYIVKTQPTGNPYTRIAGT